MMEKKTVLITGATNGIGEAIAEGLANKGAEVIIVSRSEARCATTAERLRRISGNHRIRYYAADLSNQAQITALVERLNTEIDRLDVLVNNVGAWFTEHKLSADGIEMTWALNHLSYFLMTNGLLDLLKQTAAQHGEARIINQSSGAHRDGTIHWDNLQFEGNWDTDGKGRVGPGWGVYSQSKLANVLHAFTLARQLAGTGINVNAVDPGTVVTGFSRNNGLLYQVAAPLRRLFNRTTPHQGAAPAVYLASTPEAASITGTYYDPTCTPVSTHPLANDIDAQDRLWQVSANQVGVNGTF